MEKKENMEEFGLDDKTILSEDLSEIDDNEETQTASHSETNNQKEITIDISDDDYEEVTGLEEPKDNLENKEQKSNFKKFGSDLLKDALEAAQALEHARKKKKEDKVKTDSKFKDDLKSRDETVKANFDKKYASDLETKISQLEEKVSNFEETLEKKEIQYRRLAADFENFRRRQDVEKENLIKFGSENLLLDILPILDNFERAIEASKKAKDIDSVITGLELIQRQLVESMYKNGLELIQALNNPFDPNFHESIQKMVDDSKPDQTVIHEVTKGYTLYGKVIRPTTVVISATSEEENN